MKTKGGGEGRNTEKIFRETVNDMDMIEELQERIRSRFVAMDQNEMKAVLTSFGNGGKTVLIRKLGLCIGNAEDLKKMISTHKLTTGRKRR